MQRSAGSFARYGMLGLALVLAPAVPAVPVLAASATAACAAVGHYTVVQNAQHYALNAPLMGLLPTVIGGSVTISQYTGCGLATSLTLHTTGAGSLLQKPVTPLLRNRLRSAGDILLSFTGTARQDPLAPKNPMAVRLSGTATYVRVTSAGQARGTQRLPYKTSTVSVQSVPAQLKVTTDLTGALSLSCALPGPKLGKVQSSFTYFVVGIRKPASLSPSTSPSKNL